MVTANLITKIATWYAENQRSLPWRDRPAPYQTWVSEIMLQQTQVAAVVEYFKRWMKEFPTVEKLARAKPSRVHEMWAGLGYYSRARNLQAGAKQIVAMKRMPANRAQWLEIKGVGEYSAGAICSIALNQPEAIVDGNVVRVFSRLNAVAAVSGKREEVWEWSRKYISKSTAMGFQPRDANQALMEFGALVCKPKSPLCGECPVRAQCKGKVNPSLYPAPKKKIWKEIVENNFLVLNANREILLQQSLKGEWRAGLWDLPTELPKEISAKRLQPVAEIKIALIVTNHKISRNVVCANMIASRPLKIQTKRPTRWFSIDDLPAHGASLKKSLARALPVMDADSG